MESFSTMLNSLYCKLAEESKSETLVLSRPELKKVGKKMVWKNAKSYLMSINRDPTHFINYVGKETNCNGTWKTSKKSDGIIFTIKVNQQSISNLMTGYAEKYVKCSECGSYNSVMSKDNSVRKNKILCLDCNSSRYI